VDEARTRSVHWLGLLLASLVVLEAWPWPRASLRTPFGGLGLDLGWPGLGLGLRPRPRPF